MAAAALWLAAIATLAASLWTLSQNPFVVPLVARSEAGIRAALDRSLTRALTPAAVDARIEDALLRGAPDEAAAVLALADARGIAVSPAWRGEVAASLESFGGLGSCLRCALDPATCETAGQVAACYLTVELTPAGDLRALGRNGAAAISGGEVDRLETALAALGLVATGAAFGSAGATLPVKAGATTLRTARRAGLVAPRLWDEIGVAATSALRGDVTARAQLMRIAADAGELRRATGGLGDGLAVLARADNSAELASLARVARAAGPDMRGALAVLGKARILRLAHRLSEMALAAMAFLAALAAQAGSALLWLLRRAISPPRAAGLRHA